MVGEELSRALYPVLLWFVPGRLVRGHEVLGLATLLGIFLAAIALFWWRNPQKFKNLVKRAGASPLLGLFAAFMVTNLGMLYAAHYAVAFKSPFDDRLLSPILLGLLLGLASLITWFWQSAGRLSRLIIGALLVVLLALYIPRTASTIKLFYQVGSGFATRYWRQSETIDFIKQHPGDRSSTCQRLSLQKRQPAH